MKRLRLIAIVFVLGSVSNFYAQEQATSPIDHLNQRVDEWFTGVLAYVQEHQKDIKTVQLAQDLLKSSQAVFDGLKAAEDDIQRLKITEPEDEATRVAIERFHTVMSFFNILKEALGLLQRGFAGQTGLLNEATAAQVIKRFEQAREKLAEDKFPDPRADELLLKLIELVKNAAGMK